MKNLKKENGAITIIVLVSVLFMVSFLISSYILVSNKLKSQKDILEETERVYDSTETMEDIYNSYIGNSEIIPIYTMEQLLKIGSNETIQVKEKFYNFTNTATYLLMNDFEYTGELLISKKFEGKLDGNGHTITISNDSGEKCIASDNNNFHGIIANIPDEYESKISNIVDEVPIPKGFKYVKGTKNTGIVITDDFSGEEDRGNEFVWVPVNGTTLTFSKKAFHGERMATKKSLGAYWLDENTDDYKTLKSSVEKYNGFYIGRFESSRGIEDREIAQIKRDYDPWVDIKDSVYSKASGMYDTKPEYKDYIKTHLVYPQEWDTTLNWIIQTGAKTEAEVTQDSSSWGIYNTTIQKTGSSDIAVANNIYDLAGNVAEITQELNGIDSKLSIRGGSYRNERKNYPASVREYIGSSQAYLGFRICMMINL